MNNKIKKLINTLLVVFSATFFACGGSSHHNDTKLEGTWDATYNILSDESIEPCYFFFTPNTISFNDVQEFNRSENGYEFTSASILAEGEGYIDENGTFVINNYYEGDIFGDGIYCSSEQTVTYQPVNNGETETYFSQIINCSDGWSCEDHARGISRRRIAAE